VVADLIPNSRSTLSKSLSVNIIDGSTLPSVFTSSNSRNIDRFLKIEFIFMFFRNFKIHKKHKTNLLFVFFNSFVNYPKFFDFIL